MEVIFFAKSKALLLHLKKMGLEAQGVNITSNLDYKSVSDCIILLHSDSVTEYKKIANHHINNQKVYVGVASDKPNPHHFLELSSLNIFSYFNSYMAKTHYPQMITMIESKQKWIVPEVLSFALSLASKAEVMEQKSFIKSDEFNKLTPKEKVIAIEISKGLSNAEIAKHQNITERTVKAHLTKVYKKLKIKDRLSLSAKINS